MISIAITVCNEHKELETLLDYLSDRALFPEYEVVIQIDKDNYTDEVISVIVGRGIKHWFYPLNKDFARYKNELAKHCEGKYIFYIDADEIPSKELLNNLPSILESNPEVDMFLVPRINTVENIGLSHVQKWGWNINKLENYINEKEFDLDNPQDLDEYNLLKKYDLIIEQHTFSR
jgi:glycosyltransferase involved in cell wall biosynthesis